MSAPKTASPPLTATIWADARKAAPRIGGISLLELLSRPWMEPGRP